MNHYRDGEGVTSPAELRLLQAAAFAEQTRRMGEALQFDRDTLTIADDFPGSARQRFLDDDRICLRGYGA